MFVLRNDPVTASEKEIAGRADDLLRQAEAKNWPAKEAMLAWTCAAGNVIAALAETREELNALLKPYVVYLVSTATREFGKRNP